MTATAISAVVARQPTTLAGWVTEVAPQVRPWVRLNVEFSDATASLTDFKVESTECANQP